MNTQIKRRLYNFVDERVLRHMPGLTSQRIRIRLLRAAGAYIGQDVVLAQGVRVVGPQGLTIHDSVSIARGTVLDARGGLTLRRGVLIGFESVILSSTHNSEKLDETVHSQGMFTDEVVIGEYSWIGTRCVIQPGTSIGANVIVGSAAVVTKDLADRAVYAGVPARFIRHR